jgi:putative tetracenomycin polyketide synthesis O-methyltransferase tcmP
VGIILLDSLIIKFFCDKEEHVMGIKLDNVSETMLVTLYARAKDAKSKNPILNDKKSFEIFSQLDYDFSKFEKAWASYYGILSRAKVMDNQVKKFMEKYPDCVIVSIGSGLDTRFLRIDNGKIQWYNLDLPEVIEERKLFFEPNERVTDIPKSAFDSSWTKEIKLNGKKLLIISEGVLMYFEEKQIKEFLEMLTDSFDSFEAQFDLLYKGTAKATKHHDVLKNMAATFKWGVKDGSEVVKLNPKLKQTGLINFTDEMKLHLPGWKKLLIPIFYIVNNRLGIYTFEK